MFPQFNVNELIGEVQLSAFNLGQIHDFPESEFWSRRTLYTELEAWYNGEKLNEKQTQGGRTVDKYPIKINPIRGAVQKHAYALFGETKDDSRPLANPILRPDDMKDKDSAQKGQNFLSNLWYENHGRSLMIQNALISQIYGGAVFKASYVPQQTWRRFPIRLESVHPSNFVGIPMAGDEFRLEQAWVVKAISPKEAMRTFNMVFPPNELVYYVEYWEPDYYEITINGQRVSQNIKDEFGNVLYFEGKNPFGQVPFVYIPHIRTVDFYGDSLISQNVQGIVEEMNKRVADYGDAVSDDSHRFYVLKNVSGTPEVYELTSGLRVVQLPLTPAVTGKEPEPDMDVLGASQASVPMEKLNEQLYQHFRREAMIPAVADGEDEGSQRSALTLAMRMWPLLAHTSLERTFWADALAHLDGMIMNIARLKKFGDLPEETKNMRIERHWAPMLPRDREVFINELVNRASANLGSIEHLLGLLDDIEDPEGEYERIKEQLKEINELMPQPVMGQGNPNADNKAKSNAASRAAQQNNQNKE